MTLPWRRRRREPDEVTPPDDITPPDDARRALVMGLPVVPLRHHGRLEPVEEGDVLVSVGVGPDGRAVALWSPPAGRDKLRSVAVGRGGERSPIARTRTRVAARVVVHDPRPALLTSIRNLEVAHPFVQPLPG
ncbi:MAG TPA: hypothetical protein VGR26_01990, partial [Acidimicrobiales bacterium]|nr:hypothetical protein [Acidimicrobiales bacterium]